MEKSSLAIASLEFPRVPDNISGILFSKGFESLHEFMKGDRGTSLNAEERIDFLYSLSSTDYVKHLTDFTGNNVISKEMHRQASISFTNNWICIMLDIPWKYDEKKGEQNLYHSLRMYPGNPAEYWPGISARQKVISEFSAKVFDIARYRYFTIEDIAPMIEDLASDESIPHNGNHDEYSRNALSYMERYRHKEKILEKVNGTDLSVYESKLKRYHPKLWSDIKKEMIYIYELMRMCESKITGIGIGTQIEFEFESPPIFSWFEEFVLIDEYDEPNQSYEHYIYESTMNDGGSESGFTNQCGFILLDEGDFNIYSRFEYIKDIHIFEAIKSIFHKIKKYTGYEAITTDTGS